MASVLAGDEEETFEAPPDEFVYLQPLDDQEHRTTFRQVREAALSIKLIKQKRMHSRTNAFKRPPQVEQTSAHTSLADIIGINRLAISFDAKSQKRGVHFGRDFESANLQSVRQLAHNCYCVTLSADRNSNKHCQWFYFSCEGLEHPTKFIVSGFTKTTSLYNEGMKVCVFDGQQWTRAGEQISYGPDPTGGYCLTFNYPFRPGSGRTRFAYCFPYTFTDLKEKIAKWQERRLPHLTVQTVGRTLLSNNVYCLTITNNETPSQNKQSIILTARTHSGETLSSYILEELVDRLLSNSFEAQLLRRKYIFKIFPMVNPDGTILGNYRLSYSGHDLNRKWRVTSARLHPEVHTIKRIIKELHQDNPVRLMIDLHGHSRKKAVFFYGNAPRKNPHACQELPYLMSTLSQSFSYHSCSFLRQRSKEGTQRIAMCDMLKMPYVYTMESSFCGDENSSENYSIEDYHRIGENLFRGVFLYLTKELSVDGKLRAVIHPEHVRNLDQNLTAREENIKKLYQNEAQLQVGLTAEDDDGSESAPSEGCFEDDELLKLLKYIPAIAPEEKQDAKFRIKLKEMRFASNPNKLQQTLLNVSNEEPQLRSEQSPDEQQLFRMGRCKLQIINGSIFDKNFEQRPNHPLKLRNHTEDIIKMARERALIPISVKDHSHTRKHRASTDLHVQLKTEGSDVGIPPSFYPARKYPQTLPRPNELPRPDRREPPMELDDIRIGPNHQCRKLYARQSIHF